MKTGKKNQKTKGLEKLRRAEDKYKKALDLFDQLAKKGDVLKCYEQLALVYDKAGKKPAKQEILKKIAGYKAKHYKEESGSKEEDVSLEHSGQLIPYAQDIDIDFKRGAHLGKPLQGQITNFENIPDKGKGEVRVISYNIGVDYFDKNDRTPDARHHWSIRSVYVKKLLEQIDADIICLQELSANQACELVEFFEPKYYRSAFLSQTPSDITPTGAIVYDRGVSSWQGKFAGTSLVGIFFNIKSWKPADEIGRFWLNEKPDKVPQNCDRGESDKGFGNTNTYRAVLWMKLENKAGESIYVFNSHYPLSGSSKTRFKCAELETEQIRKIAGNKPWISAGDRNLIPHREDNEQYNPETIYKVLTRFGHDVCKSGKHYGFAATWLGFTHDLNKAFIDSRGRAEKEVLDVIVSSKPAVRSFCHPGIFNLATKIVFALSELNEKIIDNQNEGRYFASDHAMLGGDIIFYPEAE